jgi:hypothetical protein
MRLLLWLLPCSLLPACSTNPSIKDLNCDTAYGACSASLEQEGFDWYIATDSDCALVTMDAGEQLPICGHKRTLGQGKEYGIKSCQACVKREP